MHVTHRLQPVKAAALVAAVMLLSVAISAAAGSASGASHQAACVALHLAPASTGAECARSSADTAPCTGCGTLPTQAPSASLCASIPARWRQLDLPPPTR